MSRFWQRLKDGPCYVIAEAGVNHNNDLETARQLIRAAADTRANAVKFQTYRAKELAVDGPHQDMLASLQMPLEWYPELKALADSLHIDLLSTPFDIRSAVFLKKLGVPALKIGSGELTHLGFLRAVSRLELPLIISTGMATIRECFDAYLETNDETAWLHCVSAYPAKAEEYNLKCMDAIRSRCCGGVYSGVVGISDHTIGPVVSIAAVAMGAQIVEKHITLDNTMSGPDHHMSMEPDAFAALVKSIRIAESAIGDGLKIPTASEKLTMPIARRVKVGHSKKRNP